MLVIDWVMDIEYIYSENFLYRPSIGRGFKGKPFPYLYKDPHIVEYQEDIKNKLSKLINYRDIPPVEILDFIYIEYTFGLPKHSFWKRDLDNTVKSLNDAYFDFLNSHCLGYDDASIQAQLNRKVVSENYFIKNKTCFLFIEDEEELKERILSGSIIDERSY